VRGRSGEVKVVVKVLDWGLGLEPAKSEVVFQNGQPQEGPPALDDSVTLSVAAKKREREGVRRASIP